MWLFPIVWLVGLPLMFLSPFTRRRRLRRPGISY